MRTCGRRKDVFVAILCLAWAQTGLTASSYAAVMSAPNVTVTGRVYAASLKPGQRQTVTATVLSNQYLPAVFVDFEVFDSLGVKVFQGSQKVRLPANQITRVTRTFTLNRKAFGGIFVCKIGVFAVNWKHLYTWNDDAVNFMVRAKERPHVWATGQVVPNHIGAGAAVTLTARVSVTGQSLSNAIVDIEVHRGAARIFQRFRTGFRVPVNGTRPYTVHWSVPWTEPAGIYTLKIGVFNSHWSALYWNDNAATVT